MRLTISIGLAAAATAAACEPKVNIGYKGEAILSVYGAVTGEAMKSDDTLDAYAAWFWYEADDPPEGESEDQIAEVTADYPFSFRIDIYQPPSRLADVDGARMSLAKLFVLNGPYPNGEMVAFVPFYAMASNHVLVYLEDDADPGSIAARFLHGELSAGFHVMEAQQRADCSTSIDPRECENHGQHDLYLAPADLDTKIPLVLVEGPGASGLLPNPWLTLEELQFPDGVPGGGG